MITRLEDKELKRQSRRQLLKLAPVAALGVFAFPKVSDRVVAAGVRFSDWASGALFRSRHPAQTFSTRLEDKDLKRQSRRQLLKLAPVAALGVFAFPKVSDRLVAAGVRFSDWVSGGLFRSQHPAQTFSNSEVVPFAKFPYNGYDVLDPEVDLEKWTLTVEGDVQHPGEYTLAQIKGLPKLNQNTRHVCVEGWDVVGAFGGTPISNFLTLIGANTGAKFLEFECADDYYESIDMASGYWEDQGYSWFGGL